ncbi:MULTISPECIES: ABC transporter ATP-binding protein [unclassified Clostridium]|uniref:Lipoprotein-releasing system ATP-binding protein LolD n=2 Tax=Clostridium TaxID=1485 RepID=B2TJG4_CLOBB|nr:MULTISPECIES: ABC transporter ATP-binding protein [unclassified Clostridium]ACD22337.1 lipoprotein-releasing system ATP-binding protein LolD [Clostridium botulinum B str. Eklund 17B (NRP)]MBN1038283.1 ABC transporter ATP-binding protein [Clostridium botulinum]MBN1051756.1 ABC transporter ATP-binding protein [Clostridium botulinum]MBN1054965.1 ABC transporter ATP-binding protein [Clostridium botulinum]MBY6974802.1 ABC transporter ATP-binding protein [Clostridium botulinum]
MAILSVKNISYSYEGTKKLIFKDISVDFEKRKIYSIIGRSGAGKTSLLSLIAGLDNFTAGDILYNNKSLNNIDKDNYRAKEIGVIFQGYNLLTNTSALENILLSMDISRVNVEDKKAYAFELLNKVGIDKQTALRKVLQLSGGEQQRVAIARALSHNPDIIIADEPTGNLDNETEGEILNILEELAHKEDKCIIIVTHSKRVANFADETWGLTNGNLIFIKE